MVTAETAVVLPVLLLVLAGAVAAVTVVGPSCAASTRPARGRGRPPGARTPRW
jgi:hypothetical protein